jgi:LPXTG-motif cell wall-anchored protein
VFDTTTTVAPAGPGVGYTSDPADTQADDTTTPGRTITVHGVHFESNSNVTVTLHSTPVVLGTYQTNAAGTFVAEVTIPASTLSGQHHLVLSGTAPDGQPAALRLALTVQSAGSTTLLPHTGSSSLPPILTGFALIAAGALATRTRRRRYVTEGRCSR